MLFCQMFFCKQNTMEKHSEFPFRLNIAKVILNFSKLLIMLISYAIVFIDK